MDFTVPLALRNTATTSAAYFLVRVPRPVARDEDGVLVLLPGTSCRCRSACRAGPSAGPAAAPASRSRRTPCPSRAAGRRSRPGGSRDTRSAGPTLASRFSSSCGRSSESQSRWLSVNQSSPVFGWKSKPTVLRTPRATISMPLPSRLMRRMCAYFSGIGLADVAGRAHRHVELAVGADLDELPAVRHVARELVVDLHRRGRIVELGLDVVVAGDLLRGRHVERALVELDPVREHQLLGDHLDLTLAALVDERVDLARSEQRADEDGALVALPQPARVEDLGREQLDLEPGRGPSSSRSAACRPASGSGRRAPAPSARPARPWVARSPRRAPPPASEARPAAGWSAGQWPATRRARDR